MSTRKSLLLVLLIFGLLSPIYSQQRANEERTDILYDKEILDAFDYTTFTSYKRGIANSTVNNIVHKFLASQENYGLLSRIYEVSYDNVKMTNNRTVVGDFYLSVKVGQLSPILFKAKDVKFNYCGELTENLVLRSERQPIFKTSRKDLALVVEPITVTLDKYGELYFEQDVNGEVICSKDLFHLGKEEDHRLRIAFKGKLTEAGLNGIAQIIDPIYYSDSPQYRFEGKAIRINLTKEEEEFENYGGLVSKWSGLLFEPGTLHDLDYGVELRKHGMLITKWGGYNRLMSKDAEIVPKKKEEAVKPGLGIDITSEKIVIDSKRIESVSIYAPDGKVMYQQQSHDIMDHSQNISFDRFSYHGIAYLVVRYTGGQTISKTFFMK